MTPTEPLILEAQARTVIGKKVRALRRQGATPIHVYGPGGEPATLQVDTAILKQAVNTAGRTHLITVKFNGTSALSFVRDVAVSPVTGELQHVDFLRVDPNRPIDVTVPVIVVGDSPATRGGQGNVSQMLRTVRVRALPTSLPDKLEANISGLLEIGASIRVRDLKLPDGVESVDVAEGVVVRITKARVEEVAVAPDAAAAAAEPAEGEAAAGAAPAAGTRGGAAAPAAGRAPAAQGGKGGAPAAPAAGAKPPAGGKK